MAIVAVQRDRPEKETKVDPLDRILKGLQIASNIFGIKSNLQQDEVNKIRAQREQQLLDSGKASEAAAKSDAGFSSAGLVSQEDLIKDHTIVDPEKFKAEYGETVPLLKFNVATKSDPENAQIVYAIPTKTFGLVANLKLKDQEIAFKQSEVARKDKIAETAKTEKDQEKATSLLAKEKKGTPAQFLAKGYSDRMENANKIIDNLMAPESGFDRTDWWEATKAGALGVIGSAGEPFKSEGLKSWEQAQSNFITAVLRRESGAAIADSEFTRGERQYFPVAGDTPKLIAQKKLNRETILFAMKREAAGDISLENQNILKSAKEMIADKGGNTSLIGSFAPPNTSLIGAPQQNDNKNFLQQYLSE